MRVIKESFCEVLITVKAQMKWYWVDWFILGLRTVNFMILILNLWQMVDQSPYTTILFGALLAYSVPKIFYLPSFIKPYLFLML